MQYLHLLQRLLSYQEDFQSILFSDRSKPNNIICNQLLVADRYHRAKEAQTEPGRCVVCPLSYGIISHASKATSRRN
jgi:hypothetical protein